MRTKNKDITVYGEEGGEGVDRGTGEISEEGMGKLRKSRGNIVKFTKFGNILS